mgnify:CR=1 FL=1
MADAGNVDPARGDVGRHQHRGLGPLELVERAFALRLALVAVDRVGRDVHLRQLLHHTVAAVLGAREDEHAFELTRDFVATRKDQFEQALLLVLLDHEEELVDPFGSGAQHQMIGIAQQDIRTGRGDAFGHHRLDRGSRAHRHEGRRANIAPRGRDDTGTRRTIAGLKIEREFFHDCGYKMSPA